MPSKFCYKVVRKLDNKFVSVICCNGAAINYKIDKVTIPKIENSKIFVFKKLKDAINFSSSFRGVGVSILKCVAYGSFKKGFWRESELDMFDKLVLFWKISGHGSYYNHIPTPKGTYYAEKIKPIKIMEV